MTHVLTRAVLGCKDREPITDGEYGEITSAKDGVVEVVSLEEKFDVLMHNYRDLETRLLTIAVDGMLFQDWDWSAFMTLRNNVGRLVGNLLSSCRMYVDHLGHHLSQLYGQGSTESKNAETWTKEQYGASFAYRFMDALRNHAQHRGHSIHLLGHHGRDREERGVTLKVFTAHPIVELEELRADPAFKKAVIQEIDQKGPVAIDKKGRIHVMPLVREYGEALSRIHARVRDLTNAKVDFWEPTLEKAIERFSAKTGSKETLGLAAARVRPDGSLQDIVPIFADSVRRRRMLKQRNPAPSRLSVLVASSQ